MTHHHILEDLKLQQHYCDSHNTQKVIWELLWGFHFMMRQWVGSSWCPQEHTELIAHWCISWPRRTESKHHHYENLKMQRELYFGQCNMTMAKVTWRVWYYNGCHMESVIQIWLRSHGQCDTNMAKVTWSVWYDDGFKVTWTVWYDYG